MVPFIFSWYEWITECCCRNIQTTNSHFTHTWSCTLWIFFGSRWRRKKSELQTQNFKYLIDFMRCFQYFDIWGCHITNVFVTAFRIRITLLRLDVLIITVFFNFFNIMFWNQTIFINTWVTLIIVIVRLLWIASDMRPRKDCQKQQKLRRAMVTHSVIISFHYFWPQKLSKIHLRYRSVSEFVLGGM